MERPKEEGGKGSEKEDRQRGWDGERWREVNEHLIISADGKECSNNSQRQQTGRQRQRNYSQRPADFSQKIRNFREGSGPCLTPAEVLLTADPTGESVEEEPIL